MTDRIAICVSTTLNTLSTASIFVDRYVIPQVADILRMPPELIRISNIDISVDKLARQKGIHTDEVFSTPRLMSGAWSKLKWGISNAVHDEVPIVQIGLNGKRSARASFRRMFPLDWILISLSITQEGDGQNILEPVIKTEGFDELWKVEKAHDGTFYWTEGSLDERLRNPNNNFEPDLEPDPEPEFETETVQGDQ